LRFVVEPSSQGTFTIRIRIPGWAGNEVVPSGLYFFREIQPANVAILINGEKVKYTLIQGYAVLERKWKKGDVVEVSLPMDVRRIYSTDKIPNNVGRVALQRGPIVYCVEWPDNEGAVSNVVLPQNASFTSEFRKDLLHGVIQISTDALAITVNASQNLVTTENRKLFAIPYYAWAHRGKGEMMIWLPEKITAVEILTNNTKN
jgi:uncharacterized protein